MKKILLLLLLIGIIIGLLLIDEKLYSPLSKIEFGQLFFDYEGKGKKICDADLIGISIHGELFDVYLYNPIKGKVNSNYPNITNKWENKELVNDGFVSKWKKCPVDSVTLNRCSLILSKGIFEGYNCFNSFYNELKDDDNYYSYIYFSELEYYFLLYVPSKENLYYIRKRGF